MWPLLKKYGKYALIVLTGCVLVVAWFAFQSWRKKQGADDAGMTKGTEALKDVLVEVGSKMTEANQQAAVEVAAARAEDDKTKAKLAEVLKISDKVERRNKLTDLYKEVKA